MKKTPITLFLLVLALLLLAGCGSGAASAGAAEAAETTITSDRAEAGDAGDATFKSIKIAEIPSDYPGERFALSDNSRDKVIKVYQSSDTLSFDLKIVSMRHAREFVEDYAEMWKLENMNTIYLDDSGSATLTGTADGFEIIITASEQSPDIPKGARSYCAILVKKTE